MNAASRTPHQPHAIAVHHRLQHGDLALATGPVDGVSCRPPHCVHHPCRLLRAHFDSEPAHAERLAHLTSSWNSLIDGTRASLLAGAARLGSANRALPPTPRHLPQLPRADPRDRRATGPAGATPPPPPVWAWAGSRAARGGVAAGRDGIGEEGRAGALRAGKRGARPPAAAAPALLRPCPRPGGAASRTRPHTLTPLHFFLGKSDRNSSASYHFEFTKKISTSGV